MKKQVTRKLTLNKTTIRELSDVHARQVRGAMAVPVTLGLGCDSGCFCIPDTTYRCLAE